MTDQSNVFADVVAAPAPATLVTPQAQPTNVDYANLLSNIQNEQGQQKYDSLPKALEGLQHAQTYIPQLKTELQSKEQEIVSLRAELAQRTSVEDVVSRLTAQQKQAPEQGQPPATSGLDQQAVLQLVQQALGQAKQQDQYTSNAAQVQQALSQKFGEKSREMVEQRARELGTTPSELGKLASQNPALVLALFNAQASSSARPTTGSQHIPASYMPTAPVLERPAKSLLSGATSREQTEYMRKIKADVYAKHGITS